MKLLLKALLLAALAVPAMAKMQPGTQIWSRTEGNVERRLTIVAKQHGTTCCSLQGHMQVSAGGKVLHDWDLIQEENATWWDEGVPVSITFISDIDGTPDETLNVMLLDHDTMVLYAPWFPNRNKIYKRVK